MVNCIDIVYGSYAQSHTRMYVDHELPFLVKLYLRLFELILSK